MKARFYAAMGLLIVAVAAIVPTSYATHAYCHNWYGTEGPDTFYSTANQCDIMDMYGGQDYAEAGPGADSLFMHGAADIAKGQDGGDYINGGYSESIQDDLHGQAGDDTITEEHSQNDVDRLCGGSGYDTLRANDDDVRDYLAGGPDSDSLLYDAGDVGEHDGQCAA